MIALVALQGVGYAALSVAMVAYLWYLVYEVRRGEEVAGLCAQVLCALAAISWGGWLLDRAAKGHGWPLVSQADTTTGIAFLMLLLHSVWSLFDRRIKAGGFAVTAIALLLASYGLGRGLVVRSALAAPITSKGELVRDALNVCGGSLLALAAAVELGGRLYEALNEAGAGESPVPSATLVHGGLFCLAVGLAIDTWWLQKIGLGSTGDAQQAGIALVWVAYFVALRLRVSRRWRGWPWTIVLLVGLVFVLPVLLDAMWLEKVLGMQGHR